MVLCCVVSELMISSVSNRQTINGGNNSHGTLVLNRPEFKVKSVEYNFN